MRSVCLNGKNAYSTWPENVTFRKEQIFIAIVNQMCINLYVGRYDGGAVLKPDFGQ